MQIHWLTQDHVVAYLYEATDFLIHRRLFDANSHLILWQVGIIGVLDHPAKHNNKPGTEILCNYLNLYYHSTHEVVLCKAAQYTHFEPAIVDLRLAELPGINIYRIATLYVPQAHQVPCNEKMLLKLKIDIANLK